LGDVAPAAPAVGAEGGEAEVVLLPVFTSAGIVRFDAADGKRFSFRVRRARSLFRWKTAAGGVGKKARTAAG